MRLGALLGRVDGQRPDDVALLAAVAAGDATALGALYERHGTALFGYLVRLAGDRMVAEEILQDTLLAIWRSASTFQGRSQVRTWMWGIGHRQAHNRLRNPVREWCVLDELEPRSDDRPGPEELALARVELAELASVVSGLRPLHREVLGLVFVDELSYPEVAAVLDVPVGTVKSRVCTARRALVAALDAAAEERS